MTGWNGGLWNTLEGDDGNYPGKGYAAQTFTVGIGGTLTGAEFYFERWAGSYGDYQLDIRTTSGGTPTRTVLGTAYANDGNVRGFKWLSFDLSPFDIHVTPGDHLALWVTQWGVGDVFVPYDPAIPVDNYGGGSAFYGSNGVWSRWDADYGFKTYVEPDLAPVPEPGSSLLLLGAGLVGLRAWRQRRH